ncbi:hypothetical protein [Patulibacter minatonensis]|uniref:hypothetical protein n=1 Tax=Patulibacter minatonensis TaxID=298163 RepID=UPI0012F7F1C8|nr:hypothetical protein [Patulibacter minatonensis]
MSVALRTVAVATVALVTPAGLALTAGSAAAAPSAAACRTALSASLATHDPTTFADRAVAAVRVGPGAATGVRVAVTRGRRTIASGTAAHLARGRTPVALKLRATPSTGDVRIRVTGRVAGCGGRSASTTFRLRAASLPVRTALRGTAISGGRTVVSVLLRAVGGRSARDVRVRLLNARGAKVASTAVKGRITGVSEVALKAADTLPPGRYSVVVSGRTGSSKVAATATQSITVAAARAATDPAALTADPSRQRVVVDWSGGSSSGRDVAGFVVPGVGHGELVCSPNTQWIRMFPTAQTREVSMLTWTYRSWDGNSQNAEKALREALFTTGTGRDFNEGFNKFQPAEKQSTGEFTALLSDRGPIGAAFAPSLVPPVGVHVTWEWDFRDPSAARCHVQAEIVAQTTGSTGVGSTQVLWRGDAGAAGHDAAESDLPGVGRLGITCQATPSGTRALRLDIPGASTVTTREGSVDTAVPQAPGPVVVALPNNGQLQIDTAAGARILVSSRWKVNDPDQTQNSCAVAAQSVAP